MKYTGRVKSHSGMERTVIDGLAPARRGVGRQHGSGQKTLKTHENESP